MPTSVAIAESSARAIQNAGRRTGGPPARHYIARAWLLPSRGSVAFRLHAEVWLPPSAPLWLPPSGGRSRHSLRNAIVGAIRVARAAGIRQATSDVTSSSATTDANVTGSIGLTR